MHGSTNIKIMGSVWCVPGMWFPHAVFAPWQCKCSE